jgi:hypothetical protein
MISFIRNIGQRALVSVFCAFIAGMKVKNLVLTFVITQLHCFPVSTLYRY